MLLNLLWVYSLFFGDLKFLLDWPRYMLIVKKIKRGDNLQRKKINENTLKVIETLLYISSIVTLIALPKYLVTDITDNFYFPIFINVLLIISITIVIWKRFLNAYLKKEMPNKNLQVAFVILALICLLTSFNSYLNTYRQIEHNYRQTEYNDYIFHHTSERVKNVTIHKEESDSGLNKYYVSFPEGTKYEVNSEVYHIIKGGFGNGNLEDDINYKVPENFDLSIEFLLNEQRIKTKIISADIFNTDYVW